MKTTPLLISILVLVLCLMNLPVQAEKSALVADTIIVNAVDPDLTATWPGAEASGARPAIDSASGVIWAATLTDDGPRGGFFRDAATHPW